MQSFTSADGETVSYRTVGAGPSVIVIPGVLSVAANYDTFANALAETFTVHTIERRGRGRSSSQKPGYCMAVECCDVRTLQKETQARCLFGHSCGGLIALETARNNSMVKKVAVFEPGVSVNGSIPVGWLSDYEKLLSQGKRLDAFVEFSAAVGPARAQSAPRWFLRLLMPIVLGRRELRQKLELLESNSREHRESARLNNTYENYRQVSADSLLLFGGKSGLPSVPTALEKLSHVLASVHRKQFPDLDHFGPDRTGPREVAQAVKAFFAGSGRRIAAGVFVLCRRAAFADSSGCGRNAPTREFGFHLDERIRPVSGLDRPFDWNPEMIRSFSVLLRTGQRGFEPESKRFSSLAYPCTQWNE